MTNPIDRRFRPSPAVMAIAVPLLLWFGVSTGGGGAAAPLRTAGGAMALSAVAAKIPCAELAKTDLAPLAGAGSRVTRAEDGVNNRQQPVCIVEGNLAPTIGFRVELPQSGWTQRYLQTGCGGLCGNINLRPGPADGCPVIAAAGFVVASTDMGHQGMDAAFGRDPQKRVDFAYRGVHVTGLVAKSLIRAFYGQPARYAYFNGCSDGGREALIEAQRFPEEFDGIIAGAPAMAFTVQNSFYHGWQARSNTGSGGKPVLLATRLPILHAAVLAACDGLDGLKDGLVSTPGRCGFDPATIVCKDRQSGPACLSAAEAATARRLYDGPRDAESGERLTQGGPQYGSELQWAGVFVPNAADQPIFSNIIANGAMPNLIFADGQPATTSDLSFTRATFDRLRASHPLFDATDPDLAKFQGHGGKLILFHGWADPHISPVNTIAYFEAVRRQMGVAAAEGFARLYLMPGMGHCSGGEGPSAFDLLTPLMDWVERGIAPDAVATRAAEPSAFGLPGGRAGRVGRGHRLALPCRRLPARGAAGRYIHTLMSRNSRGRETSISRRTGCAVRPCPWRCLPGRDPTSSALMRA